MICVYIYIYIVYIYIYIYMDIIYIYIYICIYTYIHMCKLLTMDPCDWGPPGCPSLAERKHSRIPWLSVSKLLHLTSEGWRLGVQQALPGARRMGHRPAVFSPHLKVLRTLKCAAAAASQESGAWVRDPLFFLREWSGRLL